MTDGFLPVATCSAILSPAHAGRPTAPAAMEQTLMKSRRETPSVSCAGNTSQPSSFMSRPPGAREPTQRDCFCNAVNFHRIFENQFAHHLRTQLVTPGGSRPCEGTRESPFFDRRQEVP